MINPKKLERVARAICHAAGTELSGKCVICENPAYTEPCMWEQFTREAEAAIKAVKGF